MKQDSISVLTITEGLARSLPRRSQAYRLFRQRKYITVPVKRPELRSDAGKEGILGGELRERHHVPTQFFPLAFLHLRTQHGRKQLAPEANSQYRSSHREGGFNQAHFVAQEWVLGLLVDSHRPAHYNQPRLAGHHPRNWLGDISFDGLKLDSEAPQRTLDGPQSFAGGMLQDPNAFHLVKAFPPG